MKMGSPKLRPLIVLFGLSVGATANAGDPGNKADKAAQKAEAKAEKAEAKAERAEARAEKAEAKAEKAAEKAEKAADKAEAKAEKAEAKAEKAEEKAERAETKLLGPGGKAGGLDNAAANPGVGHGRFRNGIFLLRDEFKQGKVKPAELTERLAKLREARNDRKKEHREVVKRRWGALLVQPPVREELRHHARRMAFLNRALFVAQTDPKVKDREKLAERIEKLLDREEERHEKAMARLQTAPAPGGNAVAVQASDGKGAQK